MNETTLYETAVYQIVNTSSEKLGVYKVSSRTEELFPDFPISPKNQR